MWNENMRSSKIITHGGIFGMAVVWVLYAGVWTYGHGMGQPDRDGEVRFNMATYNIFYYTPPEHANSWEQRREHVANLIRLSDHFPVVIEVTLWP